MNTKEAFTWSQRRHRYPVKCSLSVNCKFLRKSLILLPLISFVEDFYRPTPNFVRIQCKQLANLGNAELACVYSEQAFKEDSRMGPGFAHPIDLTYLGPHGHVDGRRSATAGPPEHEASVRPQLFEVNINMTLFCSRFFAAESMLGTFSYSM